VFPYLTWPLPQKGTLDQIPGSKKISSRMSWWGHTFSDATWNNPVQKLVQNPFNTDANSLPSPIKLMYDSSARYSFESTSIENSWTKYFSIDPKAFHRFLFLVLIYARLFSKLLLYQKCKSQVTCVVLTELSNSTFVFVGKNGIVRPIKSIRSIRLFLYELYDLQK